MDISISRKFSEKPKMSGTKVLLTYKRKRPSLTGALTSENEKHNLPTGDQEIDSQVKFNCGLEVFRCLFFFFFIFPPMVTELAIITFTL